MFLVSRKASLLILLERQHYDKYSMNDINHLSRILRSDVVRYQHDYLVFDNVLVSSHTCAEIRDYEKFER